MNQIENISILKDVRFKNKLINLNVSDNHIKEARVLIIVKFKKLKNLYIYGNKIDDSEKQDLKEYIKKNYKLDNFRIDDK